MAYIEFLSSLGPCNSSAIVFRKIPAVQIQHQHSSRSPHKHWLKALLEFLPLTQHGKCLALQEISISPCVMPLLLEVWILRTPKILARFSLDASRAGKPLK